MLKFFDATQNPMVELGAARYVAGKGWVLDEKLPGWVHYVFSGAVRLASDGTALSAASSKAMVEEAMPDVFTGNLLCGVYPDEPVTAGDYPGHQPGGVPATQPSKRQMKTNPNQRFFNYSLR